MDVVMSDGTYRQHLADHAGTVIVHCHWLSHEDLGCMNQFTIEECPEDDIANGVLGQCSTEESLNELKILANELGIDVGFLYGVCVCVIVLVIVALYCLRNKMGVPATA